MERVKAFEKHLKITTETNDLHVYTDGSECVPPLGYIGGFGVCCKNVLKLSEPMPVHLRHD